jgi:hypothetical protein
LGTFNDTPLTKSFIFIEDHVFLYHPREKFGQTFPAGFLMPASKVSHSIFFRPLQIAGAWGEVSRPSQPRSSLLRKFMNDKVFINNSKGKLEYKRQ